MKTIGERIKECRKALKLTQAQVARKLNVSYVAVSQWERDDTTPSGKNLYNLANALGCTTTWLLYGMENTETAQPSAQTPLIYSVPLISAGQARMWLEDGEGWGFTREAGSHDLLTENVPSSRAFAISVDDESMEPEFRVGDKVIVDPDITPKPGDHVIAYTEGAGTFSSIAIRKYRQLSSLHEGGSYELIPLNSDYPKLNSDNIPVKIIGTVIEHRRYRKKRD